MKVSVTVTITLDSHVDEVGKDNIRSYVKGAITSMKGSFHPNDEMHSIVDVKVSKVSTIMSQHEARVAAGKARAAKLTPEQRSEIARRAAAARWGSKRKEK
jgi:hypothetical protein